MPEPEARDRRATDPILIVEHDELLRRILIQDVEEMGYQVEAVTSGAAALAALESASFSVALIDGSISEPDARGLIAWAAARNAPTRFILLLPFTDGDELGRELGTSFGCLRMPFSPDDLHALIEVAQAGSRPPAQPASGSTKP